MTKSRWIIFTVIALAILGFLVVVNKNNNPKFAGDAAKIITEGPIKDRVFGSTAQKVTLIEYGDFECPACKEMYPTVKELKNKYKDKLTFIFRDYPLTSVHPNALAGSSAAEAAGQQGKFFEMHDLLYDNQDAWRSQVAGAGKAGPLLESYAKQLGLNIDTFKKDVVSKEVANKINRDRQTGGNFEVSATPTFILNGKKVAQGADELKKAVENALKETGFKL
jgi:protein-disulfide isomerase